MAAIHERLGLVPVINASGTMTALGASRAVPEAREAVAAILGEFVDMAALQSRASRAIAEVTGAEAGFVTSSSASGMTLGVAAAMTGGDLAAIARLPDTAGLKDEVVIQAGHLIDFGAPVGRMIALSGAKVVRAGAEAGVIASDLDAVFARRTAAAMFVISHHVEAPAQVDLATFIDVAHRHGVPVIVDMASEYDLTGAVGMGADLVICSAHKFLGGPTAGIVAGRRELVRSAYLQSRGIGRAMKVGKEGIAGTIAALEAWTQRDRAAVKARETSIVTAWMAALAGVPGLALRVLPDWTGNPIDRVEVAVGEASGLFAWELADRLAARDPSIRVRDDLVETGFLHLDPCNLDAGEAALVAAAIGEEVRAARARGDGRRQPFSARRAARLAAALRFPD